MTPFSGFMPAIPGSAPAFGGKTVITGQSMQTFSESQAGNLPVDDATCSFLEWVQKITDGGPSGKTKDVSMIDLDNGVLESDIALEQLQALIAEAMDQTLAGQADDQALDADSLYDWVNQLPPWIMAAMVGQKGVEPTGVDSVLSVVQAMMAVTEDASMEGTTRSATDEQRFQANLQAIVNPAGQGDDNPIDGTKQMPLADKAAPGINAKDQSGKAGFIDERLSAGSQIPSESAEPKSLHAPLGQANDPESAATNLTGEQSASSTDDASDSNDWNKHGREPRFALSKAKENELPKDQSPDAMKSAEPTPSAFQDTVKAMTFESVAHTADKPTTGQSGAMTGTEASTAKTLPTTVMDQIVDKASLRSLHGRSEIQIRLKPEFLGNVQLNIATDKEQLVVKILTDQPAVKEIIETHLHQLKSELQNQGLTIHKFDVTVNPDAQQHSGDQFAQMFQQHSSQDGGRQHHGNNPELENPSGGNPADDDRPNRDGVNYFA